MTARELTTMTMTIDDEQDAEVPLQAVRGLNEASKRAVAAGLPIVFVQDGKLIRRVGDKIVVLKEVRGRRKVAAKTSVPVFHVGDTIVVQQKFLDGDKERIQQFEGQVIARGGHGSNETVTVRRGIQGEGVERTFRIQSPRIAQIEVKQAKDVRRAKLYSMKYRRGKPIKIKVDKKRLLALNTAAMKTARESLD